ncbi:MAG: RimK family alpha-L-glutamate ligase, partial [Clostridiaceae bacterium]|nr:RimK family alpha-L-glutamate ligase [Clostridiaceae bacterium]
EMFISDSKLAGQPFLYQKFIEESCGRDVRLQVVGSQVIAAMYRWSENDFRANLTNGGSMKPYQASVREQAQAVRVAKALKLDFCGVDLLFSGETNEADILCEVNSNAHFKNIYTCTGVNTADYIMDYILRNC